jgi:hypothetical protein
MPRLVSTATIYLPLCLTEQSLLTKRPLTSARIRPHLERLLSLSPSTNPSTGIDWFVLSPFLGGPHSAITKHPQSSTAFGHRDLRVVWELYAKRPEGADADKAKDVDLVGFVGRMAEHLLPADAVCESLSSAGAGARADGTDPAYVDPELGEHEFPSMVYGTSYGQLQAVKAAYDPRDLFRYPQSVRLPPGR